MLQNSTVSAIIRRVLKLVFIDLALFFVLEYNCRIKERRTVTAFKKTRRIFYDERNPEQKKERIRKT